MNKLLALYDLAECDGITIDCVDLPCTESMSMELPDGSLHIGIDPMQLHTRAEEAVKLAHELGHCRTGSFYNRYSGLDIRQKHENRADRWAICQLVPRKELCRAMGLGNTEVWELAEYFNVTCLFMEKAMRYYRAV